MEAETFQRAIESRIAILREDAEGRDRTVTYSFDEVVEYAIMALVDVGAECGMALSEDA